MWFVGASIAFALMQKGLFSEMVLIDANHAKAEGGGDGFKPRLSTRRRWTSMPGTIRDVADCGLIIITAERIRNRERRVWT